MDLGEDFQISCTGMFLFQPPGHGGVKVFIEVLTSSVIWSEDKLQVFDHQLAPILVLFDQIRNHCHII